MRSGSNDRQGVDIVAGFRRLLVVFVVAAIVGVSSERMFWYWASEPLDHLVVALVYAPAVAGVLWLLSHYGVRDMIGVLLAAPVLGYLVEGVVTPILYTGGPFVPFFPAWFAAWHGGFGIVLLVYCFRRWLIEDARTKLLVASLALGAFWGAWSITMTLPENLEDEELIADQGGPLELLDPGEFAAYAATFTLVLAAAHLVLGRGAWVTSFEPSPATRWLWLLITGGVVVAWTFAIPWAAPMFALYAGLQIWALRRRRAVTSGPTVLEQLDGRVRLVSLAPLAVMPFAAGVVYGLLWAAELPDGAVRAFMYSVIGVQSVVGAGVMVWTLRNSRRRPRPSPGEPEGPAWPAPDAAQRRVLRPARDAGAQTAAGTSAPATWTVAAHPAS